jgi:ribonuclease BN (tRNA processing enzyme)
MAKVAVTFLGAGDAFCTAGRNQAAYLVQSDGATVLLDCGATTLGALKRERLPTDAIDTIFVSHLHGDHFAGLPFFFLEYVYQAPRRRPLCVAGPPGTEARVRDLFRAMYRDAAAEPLPYPLEFVEMPPEAPLEVGGIRVEPFRVPHTENDISLGLRLQVGGRTLVYSGDTGWTEDLIRRSVGSDLFVCECSFYESRFPFHLDYPRLAENHERFGSRRLILTHLGGEVLARSGEVELELARDGLRIEI